MTKPRFDEHSTEFGLWLREQPELDSKREKFVAHNIDYLWRNYNSEYWMLIEEKRHKAKLKFSQRKNFRRIHSAIKDKKYKGFHFFQFENTNPEDGYITLDKWKKIDVEALMKFLRFEQPDLWYKTKIFNFNE